MSTTAHEDQLAPDGSARSKLEEARAKCEGAAKPRTATQPAQASGLQGVGMKYDAGKLQAGILFEDFPRALEAVLQVATFGANKYARSSWHAVPNAAQRYEDAMYRHLLAAGIEGMDALDVESGMLHRAHAAWNTLVTLELHLRKQVERAQREAALTPAPTPEPEPEPEPEPSVTRVYVLHVRDVQHNRQICTYELRCEVHTTGTTYVQLARISQGLLEELCTGKFLVGESSACYISVDPSGGVYISTAKPAWYAENRVWDRPYELSHAEFGTFKRIADASASIPLHVASNLLLEIASYEPSEGAL